MPDVCRTKFGYSGKEIIDWEEEIKFAEQLPMNGAVETSVFCQAVGWKGYSLFSPCDMQVNCHRCIFIQYIENTHFLKAHHPCKPVIKKKAEKMGEEDIWDSKVVKAVLADLLIFVNNRRNHSYAEKYNR